MMVLKIILEALPCDVTFTKCEGFRAWQEPEGQGCNDEIADYHSCI